MQSAMVLCRFLHFTMVLSLFGACLFRPLLLGPAPCAILDLRLSRAKRWMAGLASLSAIAWLLLTTAGMTGDGADAFHLGTLQLVLGSTFFGKVWSWHLGFGLLLLIGLRANTSPRLNLLLAFLLLATLAPVGHGAMLDGLGGRLLMFNQLLHLSGVGAWIGGLMLLALVLGKPAEHDIDRVLRRFSNLGYLLVATIIVTGMINVRVLTGAVWPTPLFSGFALILLIKVLMVALMLGLALFNLVMSRRGHFSVLRRSVTLEWLLGLGAILAVSLLGTLPPMLMD
ncbi:MULTISPECIES: copper homeostasis membrane protein CopD [Pseudomonas]|uniref:copper homeostasis membrane protein CopD n=1 Tax=Pseudomonas TaxID=286 RepID=UPI0015A28723|nr:copper homeostasis membrane protein CopD [Pseudomonas gingeri]NWE48426.1 copper homeostasis membrane protein CopD [Pseudomonas gingeri]